MGKKLLPGSLYEVTKDLQLAIKTETGVSLMDLPKGTIVARKGSSQHPARFLVVEGRQNDSTEFVVYEGTKQWEELLENLRPSSIYK